ncbi:MAG: transcription antitermination factor NusB [Bacilli bacterium]|nr:transcription antitermination factor NusB [Bacilli bacterium]
MTRNEKREIIIKILYETIMLEKANTNYNLEDLISELTEEKDEFITETLKNILSNKDNIIEVSNKYLKDKWEFSRLAVPDQAIIMLGVYELLYTDTPNKVAIDEAIELSKKYSNDDIPKVINGILDSVLHNEEKINE